jgi:hypothetical protein
MAHASHTSAAAGPQDMLQPVFDWSAQCVDGFLRAQKLQLDAIEAQNEIVRRAQAQVSAVASELWDEWIAHWGGGAPIDA